LACSLLLLLPQSMERIVRILAVDDELSVATALRFVFAGPRYDITCISSSVDALAHLGANSDRFDVIIVDQKMPKLTGVEFVREIRRRNTGGRIIVVSAHLTAEVCAAYERMDVSLIFSKPFDIQRLRSAVDQLAA
jgi:two-component system response regulator (stage 0 sporulation protein F)